MSKFTFEPPATFAATVTMPMAGGVEYQVGFTFKFRTRAELMALFLPQPDAPQAQSAEPGPTDLDLVMKIATGWDLAEPFTRANVEKMHEVCVPSLTAIVETYMAELTRGRQKN